jgi:CPA1 family monovalent cation:H+ antiporter
MFETAFILLVAALLLVIIGICQPLAARLKVPPPVLLGVIGIALSASPAILSQLGWSGQVADFTDIFVNLPIDSATYIYVFLPLLVFEAGVPTRNYIRQ